MPVSYVSFANIIVDDIVFPDGTTHMNTLGGGGTHAIVGMRVWTQEIGFVASVGPDFSPQHRTQLAAYGIDLSGVRVRKDIHTPRAWQIFDEDERRIEIFRTDEEEFRQTQPTFAHIPAHYLQAKGYHLLRDNLPELSDLIEQLRGANPKVLLLWELCPPQIEADPRQIRSILERVDIFCPNHSEATHLCDRTEVEEILEELVAWGARVVALRLGKEGSAVRAREGKESWRIPVVPTKIVDVTGAGNAYCGGFLVGYSQTGDPETAGLYGAVSASFAVEQVGIPYIDAAKQAEAQRRYQTLRATRSG